VLLPVLFARLVKIDVKENRPKSPKTDEHKHGDGETEPRLCDHATDDPANLRDDDDDDEVNPD
jgi:hypothetical protein